ncbi:MAG: hypothetical protein RLZZ90_997 [Actinomycetota bacterium]
MAIQSPASRPSAAHEILTSHDAAVGWPGRGFFLSPIAFNPPPPTERVFATSQQLRVLSDFAQQIIVSSAGFGRFCDSF